ncbi:MAG: hypothetical protein K1X74_06485 [Pirellulales bacterium]|nr:hypothetical protein [Pirellulales bacterium]
MLFAELSGGTALCLMGLLMVVGVLLMRTSRQLRRGATAAASKGASLPRLVPGEATLPADAPKQLTRWEVSLHEVAREHTARLDSKIVALQQLVITAQQESARLERLLADVTRADLSRRSDEAASAIAGPHLTRNTAPPRVATAVTQAAAIQGTADSRYDAIVELDRQGVDRAAIARRTGLPIGEVDLVLDLRRPQ